MRRFLSDKIFWGLFEIYEFKKYCLKINTTDTSNLCKKKKNRAIANIKFEIVSMQTSLDKLSLWIASKKLSKTRKNKLFNICHNLVRKKISKTWKKKSKSKKVSVLMKMGNDTWCDDENLRFPNSAKVTFTHQPYKCLHGKTEK